ncbi:hypothetical protein D3272_21355 [Lichenibacterium ramalinae]|uniref:Uncharacterized protein n=1 Tax=Lichenibacterium ramalinae TaxID=2316527 RepID=A0A4Q2R796_9HYPH|nr:hypothetical protein D3272_21355 [Lichenibacterium ramalinae]
MEPALFWAPRSFLDDLRANLALNGVQAAVARRDPGPIFDWLQRLIQLQGISDSVAFAYADRHGTATWADLIASLAVDPSCPKLQGHRHFNRCGYRKSAGTCAEPAHLSRCPLPVLHLRKGALNQASYSLALFIRDMCAGDVVGWLDAQLAGADLGAAATYTASGLRAAVVAPLTAVHGVGAKLWSMALADLLLAGDPGRPRWVAAGARMIAIDTLVHGFLHRTGTLRRCRSEHVYGPACYADGGCADIIEAVAVKIDAREFNPDFPATFPRFVQHAIWRFCAAGVLDICNGVRIDDRAPCRQRLCPTGPNCDRLPLRPEKVLVTQP